MATQPTRSPARDARLPGTRRAARAVHAAAAALALALGAAGAPPALAAGPVDVPQAAQAPRPAVTHGRLERLDDLPGPPALVRPVEVWLPPGYPAQAPYAVLYMHDGQMLFDPATTWNRQAWEVDAAAARVIAEGRARPFLVVAIPNAGPSRHSEYYPAGGLAALADADRARVLALGRGDAPLFVGAPRNDAYLDWIARALKPAIDARYATAPGPDDTAIAGSSMGGLASLAMLARHPDAFGAIGALSTHWPGVFGDDVAVASDALLAWFDATLPPTGAHRLWMDHGNGTLDAAYGPLQARADAVLRARGWSAPAWRTTVYPGTDHSEAAWAARLPEVVAFLLPPRAAAAGDEVASGDGAGLRPPPPPPRGSSR